ncbi:kinetochore sim4 complex subunit FTA2 domain-containing protein [Apiospora aurea]|uniref:Kinetochore sim4 complex subunit FTA2 domain-containing protein n=1 Tax=Apiospora aurea TaxID=335848 RepID=A0ABR1Q799_9PEZI
MLEFDVACIPEPKIHQFDTGGGPLSIDFIEKLGRGLHAHVWKVCINGNIYALKLFTHFKDATPKPLREKIVGNAEQWLYFHPFPNECRAFARLKEFGQEHLAIQCYGWIEMDESHHAFMDTQIDKYGWPEEYFGKRKRYAIVKELVDFPTDKSCAHEDMLRMLTSPKVVKMAFGGMKIMHDLGIFIGDVKHNNVAGGKHIDFSRARTAPHPALPKNFTDDPFTWSSYGGPDRDAMYFEELVHGKGGWNDHFPNNKIWDRLFPSPHYIGKPRSSKGLSYDTLLDKCIDYRWPGRPELFTYEKAKKLLRHVTDSARKPEGSEQSENRGYPKRLEICKLCKDRYEGAP